jgi:uncharacterized protein (TIGR03000 family)
MRSFARALSLGALAALLLVAAAAVPSKAQDDKDAKPAKITIKTFPDDDLHQDKPAIIKVNGKATKGSGAERKFVTPPLKVDAKTKYYYTIVAVWQPNNYETYTRTRKVYVKPGDDLTVDMTKKEEGKDDEIFIRWVPTPTDFVEAMMKLGKVGKDDVVYDLGCGDGRIVVAAVSKYGAKRGVGIDLDPKRLKEAKEKAKEAKVEDKLEFRQQDVMKIPDLEKATVVTIYLSDGLNGQLWPILNKHCKPGTRIITHRFLMGEKGKETGPPPEKSQKVETKDDEEFRGYTESVHLWTIKGKEEKKDKDKEDKKDKDKEDDKKDKKDKSAAEKKDKDKKEKKDKEEKDK